MQPFFLGLLSALSHNGVVHLPGESSSIGVSPASGCGDGCFTIYNYGQNYVRVRRSDGSVEDLPWPKAYLPITATVRSLDPPVILASVDDDTRVKLILLEDGAETEITEGCPDPENMAKTLDTGDLLDLKTGRVFSVAGTACETVDTYPGGEVTDPLMYNGATFYGYAAAGARRCWFSGGGSGTAVECYEDAALVFKTDRLDDGHQDPANLHTGGDLFFSGGCLYAVNGETNSGTLRDTATQFPGHLAGKVIEWCGAAADPRIVGVGLRHPWTSTWLETGTTRVIGDVGQESCEEASLFLPGHTGIVNFGWPKFECNILRSAVAPYNAATTAADRIYTDRTRSAYLESYAFVLYIILAVAAAGTAVGIWFGYRGRTEPFQAAAVVLFVLALLPEMASAPGYTGFSNGIFSTEIRSLLLLTPPYAEWYLLVTMYAAAFLLLPIGAGLRHRIVVGVGTAAAFTYLVAFVALVEPPAVITPLPVFAILAAVVTAALLVPGNGYAPLKDGDGDGRFM